MALNLQPWRAKETWAGYAVKSQGHFVLAGWTSYAGTLWNLDDPENRKCTFTSKIRNLGLGLGGSVSVNLIFFLNAKSITAFEGKSFGNGGNFHLNLPATRLAKLATSMQKIYKLAKSSHEFYELATNAADLYQTITTSEPLVLAKEVVDGAVMAGYTYGFQGVIDIGFLSGRGGSVDNL